ncbi:MAG: helix-turn-helix domain-containing protein [Clostridia bacterium]|nr:helix-turn-helix domain-containing protein [Clostridia bacterium]
MKKLSKSTFIGNNDIVASQKHITGNHFAHFHEFCEIEYVLDGSGSCTLNGQTFEMKKGMLFFMTPLDCHSVKSDGVEIINVMFSEQLVDFSTLKPFFLYSSPKAITLEPQMQPFFEMLLTEITQAGNQRQYCATLLECLLLKLSQVFSPLGAQNLSDAVSKMYFFALYHFQNKATLSAAAAYAGLTPSYASALFKKEMQVNYSEYIDSLRFNYAKKMLICSTLSVSEICMESGFEDVPNFLRRFKMRFGMTPTQFRKELVTSP